MVGRRRLRMGSYAIMHCTRRKLIHVLLLKPTFCVFTGSLNQQQKEPSGQEMVQPQIPQLARVLLKTEER